MIEPADVEQHLNATWRYRISRTAGTIDLNRHFRISKELFDLEGEYKKDLLADFKRITEKDVERNLWNYSPLTSSRQEAKHTPQTEKQPKPTKCRHDIQTH